VSPGVLALILDQAKYHDSAGMSLDEVIAVCRNARDGGIDVVRLHSGDPSIYGATREQMNALDTLGISYDVSPGVSVFQAAAASLCTDLTTPEISQTIVLTRTAGRTPLLEELELDRIAEITASLSPVCRSLVCAASCFVVVRAIVPLIKSKYEDPAVVVLDAGGRWAVSLLSGHEGGSE
jgi:precorrin-4 methylase